MNQKIKKLSVSHPYNFFSNGQGSPTLRWRNPHYTLRLQCCQLTRRGRILINLLTSTHSSFSLPSPLLHSKRVRRRPCLRRQRATPSSGQHTPQTTNVLRVSHYKKELTGYHCVFGSHRLYRIRKAEVTAFAYLLTLYMERKKYSAYHYSPVACRRFDVS